MDGDNYLLQNPFEMTHGELHTPFAQYWEQIQNWLCTTVSIPLFELCARDLFALIEEWPTCAFLTYLERETETWCVAQL